VSVVDVRTAIIQAHHEEWARVVAFLTRRFGDLDIAEEAAAEAFATAVERWPADGVPPNPGAWLTTTANRKAIDRIRRENKRNDRQKEAQLLYDGDPPEPLDAIDDDRLRLIFTCCHPALAMQTRVALTLRMVAGLTVPEIARAFLVQETAMGRKPGQQPSCRPQLISLTCRGRTAGQPRNRCRACLPSPLQSVRFRSHAAGRAVRTGGPGHGRRRRAPSG